MSLKRRFIFYWWFVGWSCLSLGIHTDLKIPNIEIHIPFGFIRLGMEIYDIKNKFSIIRSKNEFTLWR